MQKWGNPFFKHALPNLVYRDIQIDDPPHLLQILDIAAMLDSSSPKGNHCRLNIQ